LPLPVATEAEVIWEKQTAILVDASTVPLEPSPEEPALTSCSLELSAADLTGSNEVVWEAHPTHQSLRHKDRLRASAAASPDGYVFEMLDLPVISVLYRFRDACGRL